MHNKFTNVKHPETVKGFAVDLVAILTFHLLSCRRQSKRKSYLNDRINVFLMI